MSLIDNKNNHLAHDLESEATAAVHDAKIVTAATAGDREIMSQT